MTAVDFCGQWLIFTCDTKLLAIHTKQSRESFVFDCSTAEKKPKNTKDDNNSDGSASEETGSDKVLAFTVSPSGKLVALTDDTKRLVLLRSEPSWQCISIRWVVRRCTSLMFSRAEDELLVTDKSGDVYSFSVVEPQREGELKMGHLSMLLALSMSPDDKYIITADRDEKIRVSYLRSPYNIQSFCLGHQQFVSALLVPPGHPHWLLSGSGKEQGQGGDSGPEASKDDHAGSSQKEQGQGGDSGPEASKDDHAGSSQKEQGQGGESGPEASKDDHAGSSQKEQGQGGESGPEASKDGHAGSSQDGTIKLWEYESGRKLQSWDLKELEETPNSEADKGKKPTVCRITSSPDGCHVAVQCERVSTVQFFSLDQEGEEKLVPHSRLSLPHCPQDMTFDPEGRLWVVMDSSDVPLQIYTHRRDSWECDTESPEMNRVTAAFKPHWETLEASTRTHNRLEHLYKVSFDNVTAYLQKKQQRLEEQQLKRMKAQKANGNKKAKKETSDAVTHSST